MGFVDWFMGSLLYCYSFSYCSSKEVCRQKNYKQKEKEHELFLLQSWKSYNYMESNRKESNSNVCSIDAHLIIALSALQYRKFVTLNLFAAFLD